MVFLYFPSLKQSRTDVGLISALSLDKTGTVEFRSRLTLSGLEVPEEHSLIPYNTRLNLRSEGGGLGGRGLAIDLTCTVSFWLTMEEVSNVLD